MNIVQSSDMSYIDSSCFYEPYSYSSDSVNIDPSDYDLGIFERIKKIKREKQENLRKIILCKSMVVLRPFKLDDFQSLCGDKKIPLRYRIQIRKLNGVSKKLNKSNNTSEKSKLKKSWNAMRKCLADGLIADNLIEDYDYQNDEEQGPEKSVDMRTDYKSLSDKHNNYSYYSESYIY